MAKPDDDHTCQPILNPDGTLAAVVHGAPDMSPEARAALAELVAAVQRHMVEQDPDGEMAARQEASRQRIRERNRRLFGDG